MVQRKILKTYSNHEFVLQNDCIKDTIIRLTYSERKQKATGHVLITASPYRDVEESPHHWSCLHDAIINAAPRIGENIDKSELYRQFSPKRVMDTTIDELDKCECVSSVIKIDPVLDIDREKWLPWESLW